MTRFKIPFFRPATLVAALLFALPALAAGPRFVSLFPTETGWQAEVEARVKRADQLVFFADGEVVTARVETAGSGRYKAVLSDVPDGVRSLAVGTAGKKGSEPAAAVVVTSTDNSFSAWTIYHIMLGHFANGDTGNDGQIDGWRHPNYAGGDLKGVLDKADYIAGLGASAVWLSPMLASRTSHGYDIANYYRIGDAVGVAGDAEASLELYRKLRDALHERDVKVILDLPLNHASRTYDLENGVRGEVRPRSTGPRQEAEKVWDGWGAGFRYWNFGHEPTREFLKDAALYWLNEEGADGLRLDYVRGVEHEFWAELYQAVKEAKPEAFLVGECWIDGDGAAANAREIARYYAPVEGVGPQFDSLLDFPTQITATDVFARGGSALQLEAWLQAIEPTYGAGAMPTSFLDNHDMTRFLSWTDERARLNAAVGFLASLSSPMVIFYGTEAGLLNAAPKPGFVDSGRVPMPWDSLDRAYVESIAEILKARRDHPALGRGGRLPLGAGKDFLVMAKTAPEETALVAVNLGSEPRTIEIETGALLAPDAVFKSVTGNTVPAPAEGGAWSWQLPTLSTSIVVTTTGRDEP